MSTLRATAHLAGLPGTVDELPRSPAPGTHHRRRHVSGVAVGMSSPETALLVLAIGCGSLVFSHVNDAGFWLVKEYFGLTVGQTLKSWSVMETAISVVGVAFVLLLSVFV